MRHGWLWLRRREGSVLLFLALFLLYMRWAEPRFFSAQHFQDLLMNSAYTALAATGMTCVIVAGQIDISIGSMLAVCAVVAGKLAKQGLPLAGVTLATLAVGAALGAVNGLLVAYAGVPAIITTLGMLSILRGAMIWVTKGYWIRDLPPEFYRLGEGTFWGVPYPLWLAGGMALGMSVLLAHTPWGRHLYAVGGHPQGALRAGIPIQRIWWQVFVLCGVMVGLASLVYASRFTVIQSNAGEGFELLVITAVVVGGTNIFGGQGSVGGSILGVLLLSTLSSAMTFLHVDPYWERTVQGTLILLAILSDRLRGWGGSPP